MGELFADAGYATGMFGKWHLGKTPNDTIVVWASDNGSGITSGEAWGSGGYWRGVFGGGWEGSYRSPAMLMTSEMTYAWVIGLASQPLLELAKSATQYRHIEPGEDLQVTAELGQSHRLSIVQEKEKGPWKSRNG